MNRAVAAAMVVDVAAVADVVVTTNTVWVSQAGTCTMYDEIDEEERVTSDT